MSRFGAATVLACLGVLGLGTHVLAGEPAGDWNFDPPKQTLHLHFWHHSTGTAWLTYGLRDGLGSITWDDDGTPTRSYLVSDYGYGGQNDYTDYHFWYKRFRMEMGVEGADGKNYPYHKPQTPENEIAADNFMLTCYNYARQLGETMAPPERIQILMFKPCFPGSALYAFDTQYDAEGHVIGGTPWSDSGHTYTNFDYLDSVEAIVQAYASTYWPATPGVAHSGGYWTSGASASLAQLKVAYRGMLNVFYERPDVLFIAVQAPPLTDMTAEQRAACRELARWFREDWLHEYDPTGTDTFEDYRDKNGKINVACFDYYNSMAYTGDDAVYDAAYSWFPGDGWTMPDEFNDWEAPHVFVQYGMGAQPLTDPAAPDNIACNPDREIGEARDMEGDSHPSPRQHYHAADIFIGMQRNAASQGYNSWINAVVNRWLGDEPIVLTIAQTGPAEMTLTWNSEPGVTYEIHAGPARDGLSLVATQPSEGATTDWTDPAAIGFEKYYRVIKP